MEKPLPVTPSLSKFIEKVRVLNQSQSKSVVLTATEARNIESDIMTLLTMIVDLQAEKLKQAQTIEIDLGGTKF
jgi:hypothetical protein